MVGNVSMEIKVQNHHLWMTKEKWNGTLEDDGWQLEK
jgi:hypothetical protein